jgi:hypothetical protein
MINTLTRIGITITAVYSLVIFALIYGRVSQLITMPLNELGDFLAGVFGPLAIFWLILGFLQQGKELQQSTQALELQAQELNNSVQQQRELVEVTREQVEAELEALKYERQRQVDLAKPNFIFHGVGGSHHGDGTSKLRTTINNTGGTVTHATIFSDGVITFVPNAMPSWETNREHMIEWAYKKIQKNEEINIFIEYTDSLGNRDKKSFVMVIDNSDQHPVVDILIS